MAVAYRRFDVAFILMGLNYVILRYLGPDHTDEA